MSQLNTRTAATWYVLLMALWVYGFGVVDRQLPALLVFILLLGAATIHVGVGYLLARWEAIALAAVPVLLAIAISGLGSSLWVTLLLLMVFPGAPLIAAGVYFSLWQAERTIARPTPGSTASGLTTSKRVGSSRAVIRVRKGPFLGVRPRQPRASR